MSSINKIGICSNCNKNGVITKPSLGLCYKCNNRRLSDGKESKQASGQYQMFLEIWDERPHVSFVSGQPLDKYYGGKLFVNMFAHVLSKGAFPNFKLKKENIVLLTPFEHTLYDTCSENMREAYGIQHNADWNKLYTLKDDLKREYYE